MMTWQDAINCVIEAIFLQENPAFADSTLSQLYSLIDGSAAPLPVKSPSKLTTPELRVLLMYTESCVVLNIVRSGSAASDAMALAMSYFERICEREGIDTSRVVLRDDSVLNVDSFVSYCTFRSMCGTPIRVSNDIISAYPERQGCITPEFLAIAFCGRLGSKRQDVVHVDCDPQSEESLLQLSAAWLAGLYPCDTSLSFFPVFLLSITYRKMAGLGFECDRVLQSLRPHLQEPYDTTSG